MPRDDESLGDQQTYEGGAQPRASLPAKLVACIRNTVFEGNNDVKEKLQDHYRVLFRVYDWLCSGLPGGSRTLSEFLLAFLFVDRRRYWANRFEIV
jgi:hypothetical protein